MPHRRGRARILTAAELRDHLAVPCYYILIERAQAAFPHTATPHPSRFVQVIRTGDVDPEHVSSFPVFVNWRQWNDIVAPLLEDCRWPAYLGSAGGCHEDTSIPTFQIGPGLHSCNDALRAEYIQLIGAELYRRALDVQT